MGTLIASLSTGKGTWGHVSRLIEDNEWDKVILITNEFGRENFKKNDKTELVAVKTDAGTRELRDEIYNVLKERVKDSEVGVNFVSGSGKEHMALMSALLKLGVGIRLVALTQDGMEEI